MIVKTKKKGEQGGRVHHMFFHRFYIVVLRQQMIMSSFELSISSGGFPLNYFTVRYVMGSVRDGTFGHVSMRITKKSRSDIDPIPYRTVPTKVELSSTFQRYGIGSTRGSNLLANQRRVSLVFID